MKLPLKYNEFDYSIIDADGVYICGETMPEQGRQIVRAVNWHQELLTALKTMVEVGAEFYDMDMGENGSIAITEACKAIANAENEEKP
jgi:hypothetical protein